MMPIADQTLTHANVCEDVPGSSVAGSCWVFGADFAALTRCAETDHEFRRSVSAKKSNATKRSDDPQPVECLTHTGMPPF